MKNNRHVTPGKWGLIISVIVIFLVSISCDLSTSSNNDSAKMTLAALDVQGTVLAQQNVQNIDATNQAMQLQFTKAALDMQGTIQAQQALLSAVPPTSAPPTPEPPTAEPPPVQDTVAPPPTVDTSGSSSAQASGDVDAKIKAAKILLFEDMSGTGWYRYVQEGLDLGDWSYTDVGSAQGWFKDKLLSGTDWDLIIAASESRTKIQGEFFVYLMDYIKKGTAVIIEHWAIDDLSQGKIAPILAKCGVALDKDWFVALGTVPNLSVWFLQPDNPILHYPNEGISLRRYTNFWVNDTDKGDLLKLTGSGDAQLIAGTHADRKSDHGTIVSCMGGRLIIMTQSSHEYYREDITRLWENVAYQALKAHFMTTP